MSAPVDAIRSRFSFQAQTRPNLAVGTVLYGAIEGLTPKNPSQQSLKERAFNVAVDLAQMQWLFFEQSGRSISWPMLIIVAFWLAILFLSFGLFAPRNPTAVGALVVAALSVSTALFLILELDRPLGGWISISSEPMLKTLQLLGK